MNHCWWRRGLVGCAVTGLVATLAAFAEADQDAASQQPGAAPAGAEPNNDAARPGCATVNVWGGLDHSLTKSTPLSVSSLIAWYHRTYPDEIPWLMPAAQSKQTTVGLGELGPGESFSLVRARCLLTAPQDGYYLLSLEGDGYQQVLLSDDATPGGALPLWTTGKLRITELAGFDPDRVCTEGSWQYFKRGVTRYVEIRHMHRNGPLPLKLVWTLPDGTRQPIPAACVTSFLPPKNAAEPGDGTSPDGIYGAVLHSVKAIPGNIDLATAKPLSSGWAAFNSANTLRFSDVADPKPDLTKPGLTCIFGGDLEFTFVTKDSGYAVVSSQMQLCEGTRTYVHVLCEREIDGVRFDRDTLRARDGSAPNFRCVTPWLEAGTHCLRLHFTPCMLGGACRIFSLGVQTLTSADATAEVRALLEKHNGFLPERGDGGFLRSPACVEIASRTSAAPALHAGEREIHTQPATSNTWWADVELPQTGDELALVSRSPADRTEVRAMAHWAQTRVSEHPELYLREGDALRLTAWPAEAAASPGASAVVILRGKQTATPAGKPWVCRFEQAGDEVIEARFTADQAPALVSRMTVHVLPRRSNITATELTRTDRRSDLDGFQAGAWPDGGDAVMFRACPANAGRNTTKWSVYPQQAGTLPTVTRAGANGPVLGMMRVRAAGVSQMFDSRMDAKSGPNSQDVICDRCVVSGLPPGWKIRSYLADAFRNPWRIYQLRPDLGSVLLVNPWRCGAAAVGEIWLIHSKAVAGLLETRCELVPPDANPEPPQDQSP